MYTALPSTTTDNHETECSNPILEDLTTQSPKFVADCIANSKKQEMKYLMMNGLN